MPELSLDALPPVVDPPLEDPRLDMTEVVAVLEEPDLLAVPLVLPPLPSRPFRPPEEELEPELRNGLLSWNITRKVSISCLLH